MKFFPIFCIAILIVSGCSTGPVPEERPRRLSPTEALVRGELSADEYLDAVRQANEEDRRKEQFELNKEPTRAYNTKTGRIEYVPEGTSQSWNETTQRWEFTPID